MKGLLESLSQHAPALILILSSAVLALIGPSVAEMRRAVAVLALATFAFLLGASVLAPDALFEQGIEGTKVFLADPERGRRINAPMMFASGRMRPGCPSSAMAGSAAILEVSPPPAISHA